MRAPSGMVTVPLPYGQIPASARNSTLLPQPDGPLTSQRSPGATDSENGATSGRWPTAALRAARTGNASARPSMVMPFCGLPVCSTSISRTPPGAMSWRSATRIASWKSIRRLAAAFQPTSVA